MEQISPILQAYIEQHKAINNLNQNNNVQFVDLSSKPDTFESGTKKEDENKKSKILKIAAIGAAILAAATGIFYAVRKGKSINLKDMTPEKFKQIQTDRFTGKIKGELKNGDKIVMEYVDGVLKKSTRSGEVNFEKVYETVNNEKIVKKTIDGVTTEINIHQKIKHVLSDKLWDLWHDKRRAGDCIITVTSEMADLMDNYIYCVKNQKVNTHFLGEAIFSKGKELNKYMQDYESASLQINNIVKRNSDILNDERSQGLVADATADLKHVINAHKFKEFCDKVLPPDICSNQRLYLYNFPFASQLAACEEFMAKYNWQ